MNKFHQLRQTVLEKIPNDLFLSKFSYEEKYFEKTNDYVVSISIPVEIDLSNLQEALDCGMSTSIVPKVLNGETIINYFCFAFRTFGETDSFYFWSETEEESAIRLPYFQSINVGVRYYGIKPIDEFYNVISGIFGDSNNKEQIGFYINSIADRSKLFLKNEVEKVNVSMLLFELFITNKNESVELLKVDVNTLKTIEKFKDNQLKKGVYYDKDYSLKSMLHKLVG